jgi:hypothetical protein
MNIYINTDVNTYVHIYVSHIQDNMQEQEALLPQQRLRNIQDLFMQASLFHTSQERSPIKWINECPKQYSYRHARKMYQQHFEMCAE